MYMSREIENFHNIFIKICFFTTKISHRNIGIPIVLVSRISPTGCFIVFSKSIEIIDFYWVFFWIGCTTFSYKPSSFE